MTMVWQDTGRVLINFLICFNIFIKVGESTGVLEIRFTQYEVVYIENAPHAGIDPSSVSMAPNQTWEEVTQIPLTNTTADPNIPSAWQEPPSCDSPARYRFLVCMDMVGQPETCALGREDTGLLQVTQGFIGPQGDVHDIVVFGTLLRGMPNILANPIRYNIPSWPGAIKLTTYVQCCGAPDTERCQEKITGNLATVPLSDQSNEPTRVNMTNDEGAMLEFAVTVRCSPNFYGVNCSTFCRNDQTTDRVCHPQTGQLVCRPGFTGPDCDEDLDECALGACRHGAGCDNQIGSFTCHCLEGSTGRLCENRTPTCPSQPCRNEGTCEEDPDSMGFICQCLEGWGGDTCETPLISTTTLAPTVIPKTDAKTDVGQQQETEEEDWTLWYVGIALLCVAVIVIVVLILCVVCTSRRRRYHISEVAKSDPAPTPAVTSQSQFDNIVYLHDPEDIDLQPATSHLYQRTLVPDDPYINERPLYQDRITPDVPYGDEDDICVSRREVAPSARDNVYSIWGSAGKPEEFYEDVSVSGDKDDDLKKPKTDEELKKPEPEEAEDGKDEPKTELSPGYRKASDPAADPYSIFDFLNTKLPVENTKQDKHYTPMSNGTVGEHKIPTSIKEEGPYDILIRDETAKINTNPFIGANPFEPTDKEDERRPSDQSVHDSLRRNSTLSRQESFTNRSLPNSLRRPSDQSAQDPSRRPSNESDANSYGYVSNQSYPDSHRRQSNLSFPDSLTYLSYPDATRRPSNFSFQDSLGRQSLQSEPETGNLVIENPILEPSRRPSEQSHPGFETPQDRRPSTVSTLSPGSRRSSNVQPEHSPAAWNMTYADPNELREEMVAQRNSVTHSNPGYANTRDLRSDTIAQETGHEEPAVMDMQTSTLSKKPCPTPRASLVLSEEPSPMDRNQSDTSPYLGQRRPSQDLLTRLSSGSLQPDWPTENGRKKSFSFDLKNI